jgi:hypothetical protein
MGVLQCWMLLGDMTKRCRPDKTQPQLNHPKRQNLRRDKERRDKEDLLQRGMPAIRADEVRVVQCMTLFSNIS